MMDQLLSIIPSFLLVFTRITSFFLVAPIFSYKTIPNQHKVGWAMLLSLIVTSSLSLQPLEMGAGYFLLVAKELAVGITLALLSFMLFTSVQIAGTLIDFQVGFSMASMMDPMTG
ncbi:MAG: flagellar biosynthetic protein FliR, partial [Bacilli bacterium]